jgi:hypothetical protein
MANPDDLGSGRPSTAARKPPHETRTASEPSDRSSPVTGTGCRPSPNPAAGGSGQRQAPSGETVAEQVKEGAKDLASQVTQQTAELAGQARDQVSSLFTQQKDHAARRLSGFAGALREAADKLSEESEGSLGHYAYRAADQVDRVSSYVRENDIRSFLDDVEQFAQRRPEVFLGSLFLAGFVAARFVKASGDRGRHGHARPTSVVRQPYGGTSVPQLAPTGGA